MKKVWLPVTVIFLMTVIIYTMSYGDVILYKVPGGEVVEAFREPIPLQPGYAQIAVPNADLIIWPVPTGCTQGQKKWAIVNVTTTPPSFILNPAFKFFLCQLVSSATDVDRVAEEEVAKLTGPSSQKMMKQLRQAITLLDTLTVECPPDNLTSDCNTKRTKALNTRTTLLNLNNQIDRIYSDATAFKAAQGW